MNKKRGFVLGGFLITVFLISLVAAAEGASDISTSINEFIDGFTKSVQPLASQILGTTPEGSEYLFAKVLFLIIILAIVWTALGKIDFFASKNWALWLVSLAVSILATRWLTTEEIINTIILPYSTLGIAISAGLPFVLWFVIINAGMAGKPPIIRRIAWIFFAVIFIGLYLTRKEELTGARWIYPVTAIGALIIAAMDGTISRLFAKMKLEKKMSTMNYIKYTKLLKERDELHDAYIEAVKTGSAHAAALKRELVNLDKTLAGLLR